MGPETGRRDLGAHPAWNPSNGNVSSSILTHSAQKLPIDQKTPTCDLEELQGETLVPNSPTSSSSPTSNDSDGATQMNDTSLEMNPSPQRLSPSACIFVANLNSCKTRAELGVGVRNVFSQWGQINQVKVFVDRKHRPFAFVQYKAKNKRCSDGGEEGPRFASYGLIEDMHILYSGPFTTSYVKFCYRSDALNAYFCIAPRTFGAKFVVDWVPNINASHLLHEDGRSEDVFLGNLDSTILNSDIYHRFSAYGTILNITLFKRRHTDFKAMFGFVKYATREEAAHAVSEEHGQKWYGHSLCVSFRQHQKRVYPGYQNKVITFYGPSFYQPPSYPTGFPARFDPSLPPTHCPPTNLISPAHNNASSQWLYQQQQQQHYSAPVVQPMDGSGSFAISSTCPSMQPLLQNCPFPSYGFNQWNGTITGISQQGSAFLYSNHWHPNQSPPMAYSPFAYYGPPFYPPNARSIYSPPTPQGSIQETPCDMTADE
ncbi:hypothetical protein [Absidia glauca]|uniref:RRM domain-containing protein n=1 Tax=Absidia glauca TaxID=4829 RepID=A0A168LDC4_ABSGL|nr:hypothetical protein [Absidia glauca]